VFLVGPQGSHSKEIASTLATKFKWQSISLGTILKDEVAKKTAHAGEIQKALNGQRFIPDSLAIDLVKREIDRLEKEGQSWILEGFPRSQVQALSLQKLGVSPDKVIVLKIREGSFHEQVKKNLKAAHTPLYGP
jgi:adenylate kinase